MSKQRGRVGTGCRVAALRVAALRVAGALLLWGAAACGRSELLDSEGHVGLDAAAGLVAPAPPLTGAGAVPESSGQAPSAPASSSAPTSSGSGDVNVVVPNAADQPAAPNDPEVNLEPIAPDLPAVPSVAATEDVMLPPPSAVDAGAPVARTGCTAADCPDDGNLCNGIERCDPVTGDCVTSDPPECDDGIYCNGPEHCDPVFGCFAATEPACSEHGTCSEAQRTCECDDGFYGDDCNAVFQSYERHEVVRSIQVQGDLLWLGTRAGLWLLDHGGTPEDPTDDRSLQFSQQDGLSGVDDVGTTRVDPAGGVWIAAGYLNYLDTAQTPFDKSDDQWIDYADQAEVRRSERTGLSLTVVYDVDVDEHGVVWLGPSDHPPRRFEPSGTPLDPSDDEWLMLDQLPSNRGGYHSIATAPQGAVWWAGGEELSGFDPLTEGWATFTGQSTGLSNEYFLSVHPQGDSRVWTLLDMAGVDHYVRANAVALLDHNGTISDPRDDRWVRFDAPEGLGVLQDIAVDPAGVTWVADLEVGVSRVNVGAGPFDPNDSSWVTTETDFGLYTVVPRSSTELWLGGVSGVSYFNHGGTADPSDDRMVNLSVAAGLLGSWVSDIAVDAQGGKWMATPGAASYLDDAGTPLDPTDDRWTHFASDELPGLDRLVLVSISPLGTKYFIGQALTSLAQLQVLHDAGTPTDTSDDLWLLYADTLHWDVRDMAVDAREYLLVASPVQGLQCLDTAGTPHDQQDDSWVDLGKPSVVAEPRYLLTAPGGFWVGTSEGLYFLDDGGTSCDARDDVFTRIDSGPAPSGAIESLSRDAAGGIWVAFGDAALFAYFDPGERLPDATDDVWAAFDAGADKSISSLRAGALGEVWVEHSQGVLWLDTRGTPLDPTDDLRRSATRGQLPLPRDSLNAICPDPAGGLWIATTQHGARYLDMNP